MSSPPRNHTNRPITRTTNHTNERTNERTNDVPERPPASRKIRSRVLIRRESLIQRDRPCQGISGYARPARESTTRVTVRRPVARRRARDDAQNFPRPDVRVGTRSIAGSRRRRRDSSRIDSHPASAVDATQRTRKRARDDARVTRRPTRPRANDRVISLASICPSIVAAIVTARRR